MFRRKPVPTPETGFVPSPILPPPMPPPMPPSAPPKPPIAAHFTNDNVLNASEEWNEATNSDDDDDNRSEWWDNSDDEEEAPKDSNSQNATSGSAQSPPLQGPRTQNPIPQFPQPPPSQPTHAMPRPNQDYGDPGIGSQAWSNTPSLGLGDKLRTNPFLRKTSQGSPNVPNNTTGMPSRPLKIPDKPPQLTLPRFSTGPLSPKILNAVAGGNMSGTPNATQALTNNVTAPRYSQPSAETDLISFEPTVPTVNPANQQRRRAGSDAEKEVVATEDPPANRAGTMMPSFQAGPVQQSIRPGNVPVENPPANRAGTMMPSFQAGPVPQPIRPGTVPQLDVPPVQPSTRQEVETPSTTARKQRNESYQIKHIRWYDPRSSENPRISPILVQNANGPCPLLALVNALVLTTPSLQITPLIETLRTRENITLGTLLDAVFDELMSERRAGGGEVLPDVGELYSFLITLHTGMNVNPRFVPQNEATAESSQPRPGDFEETREMRLYSTFSIPLMHGWIPQAHDEAYSAFSRLAPTYEDAQNMAFREVELEQKLHNEQLTDEEETLYIDLTTMKEFLTLWPTQLTDHGLISMNQFLRPGQVAILFRNDHFSTIYKEPRTSQLMTLVTDAGYSSHDEIVWESLVDINGNSNELFSGDFRSVSHNVQPPQQQLPYDGMDGGWTTVEGRTGQSRRAAGKAPARDESGPPPSFSKASSATAQSYFSPNTIESGRNGSIGSNNTSSTIAVPSSAPHTYQVEQAQTLPSEPLASRPRATSEQEDHDLALALQLQEEEEHAQRNAAEARRREDQLSLKFLSDETARGSGESGGGGNRTSSGGRGSTSGEAARLNIPPRRSSGSPNVPITNTTSSQTTSPNPTPNTRGPVFPPPPTQALDGHSDPEVDEDDELPPTYEAATAKGVPAYVPGTTPIPTSSLPTSPGGRPTQTLYSQNSSYYRQQSQAGPANTRLSHLPPSRVGQGAAGRRKLSSRGSSLSVGRGGGGAYAGQSQNGGYPGMTSPSASVGPGLGRGVPGAAAGTIGEEEKCAVM